MATVAPTGQNAEQIKYWNEIAAPRWISFQRALDTQLDLLGQRAMDAAAVAPGDRVLDVGCGCGATTRTLAGRVGERGSVLGVDIAAAMLEVGRETAAKMGLRNVRFEDADAQVQVVDAGTFDVVFSRFGVMFFADPVVAFANLRTALRADGRLGFVCWQAAAENPWVAVPMRAAAAHLALSRPADPNAPGPFAFANPDRVRDILDRAGFQAVRIDELREILSIGGPGASLDEVVEFALQMGPVGAALRQADPALVPKVAGAVREALAPLVGKRGLEMASAAWVVSARA